jgi:hypothetical protein
MTFGAGGSERLRITTDGQIAASTSGTAASPVITRSDDLNTGIFFPAADTIAFTEGGAEAMRIDSSGNVGIGTTSPSGVLHLSANTATTTLPSIVLQDTGTTATRLGSITNNNGDLVIAATASLTDLRSSITLFDDRNITFSTTATERMRIDSSGNVLVGATSVSFGAGTGVVIQRSGTATLRLSDATNSKVGELRADSTGVILSARGAYPIRFDQDDTERMRIDSSGNVGIGTTGPIKPLSVEITSARSATTDNEAIRVSYGTNSGVQQSVSIGFATGVTQTNPAAKIELLEFDAVDSRGSLLFYTRDANSDTAPTERMRITDAGDVYVGTTNLGTIGSSSGFQIRPNGTIFSSSITDSVFARRSTNGEVILFRRDTTTVGNISVTTTATTYNTSSDYRLKENIAPMIGALDRVAALKPCTYTWKADGSAGEGFIAHELAEVCPAAVTGEKDATEIQQVEVSPAVYEDVVIPAVLDEDGNEVEPERTEKRLVSEAVMEDREFPKYQGVDTSFLVATLTAAIQELSAKNDALEARLAALEAK